MAKISDLTAMTGAAIDASNDLITMVDASLTGVSRNKKMTFAELKATVSPLAVAADIWTGTSTTKVLPVDQFWAAAATVALTDGATITPDFGTGINFSVTLGGSRTLANPTNAKTGQSGVIIVTQDGTGSRVLTYGTKYKFPGGAAVGGVLSTAAGSVDVISYYVRSNGDLLCTLSKAFSS